MSDFFNDGWSVFVAAATVLGLVACIALLIIASRRQPAAADNTTGHPSGNHPAGQRRNPCRFKMQKGTQEEYGG